MLYCFWKEVIIISSYRLRNWHDMSWSSSHREQEAGHCHSKAQCITLWHSGKSTGWYILWGQEGAREKPARAWASEREETRTAAPNAARLPRRRRGRAHPRRVCARMAACPHTAAFVALLGRHSGLLLIHVFCKCMCYFVSGESICSDYQNRHLFKRIVKFVFFFHHEFTQLRDTRRAVTVLCSM